MLFLKVGNDVVNLERISAIRFVDGHEAPGAGARAHIFMDGTGPIGVVGEDADALRFYVEKVAQYVHHVDRLWEKREEITAALAVLEAERRKQAEMAEQACTGKGAPEEVAPPVSNVGQAPPVVPASFARARIPALGTGPRTVVGTDGKTKFTVIKGGREPGK